VRDNNNNKPLHSYLNSYLLKTQILKDNKGKCGIYRWINSINNKSYIGSSINLHKRLSNYYSVGYLNNSLLKASSIIYKALLKYGYKKFKFEILEYCEPHDLLEREQYYIDYMKPEYNILKTAGSNLGSKVSLITKEKISNGLKKYYKTISLKKIIRIKVVNIQDGIISYYTSNLDLALYLQVSESTIIRYKNNNKLLLNKYIITNYIIN